MEKNEIEAHQQKQTELAKEARDAAAKPDEPIVKFFAYGHLPEFLREVSKPFADLADTILKLPRSAERTVALRKLLESKDAAVRAALP